MVAIRRALEPQETAAAKERMSKGGREGKESFLTLPSGQTRDKVAEFTGVSGRTLTRPLPLLKQRKPTLKNLDI